MLLCRRGAAYAGVNAALLGGHVNESRRANHRK